MGGPSGATGDRGPSRHEALRSEGGCDLGQWWVLHIGAAHAGVRQVYRGRGLDAMDLAGVAIEVVIHWCFSLDSLAKLHSRSCTIWFQPVSSGRRRDNWLSCTCRAAVFSTI